jgi:serine/threonine protein kinase
VSTLLAEVKGLLRRFISDPHANGASWRQLIEPPGNLLGGALESVVEEAIKGIEPGPAMFTCIASLRDPQFIEAVRTYYSDRGDVHVDATRIARNALGLSATAMIATVVQRFALAGSGSPDAEELAQTWAEVASSTLTQATGAAVSAHPGGVNNPSDPAWQVERVFRDLMQRRPGLSCTTAFYWTLYWLNRQQGLETGAHAHVPVAAAGRRTGTGLLGELSLLRLLETGSSVLIEHPETALLPLGRELIGCIERAWRLAAGQSVCWRLNGPYVPQDGDSLGGAAAVAFRNLLHRRPSIRSCLVLARLGEGEQLLPVGYQKQKLLEAYTKGIRTAVLAVGSDEWLTQPDSAELESRGLRLAFVSTVSEAEIEASGHGETGLGWLPDRLLERYTPLKRLPTVGRVESWLGKDEDGESCLIKTWPIEQTADGRFGRALWDRELRNMYRLSSSPTAESSLMVMKDAGLDHRASRFVMVMKAPGYTTLAVALAHRSEYPWLTRDGQIDHENRRHLWSALRLIAEGVSTLHKQHMVHRYIVPDNVFFSPEQGFDTWRLGGFEWSVRFGSGMPDEWPQGGWHVPPEVAKDAKRGVSFEDDWYALGMLAARCFYRLDGLPSQSASEINQLVVERVKKDRAPLEENEAGLILDLIQPSRDDRLKVGYDLLQRIDGILESLVATVTTSDGTDEPLLLVFSHRNEKIVQAAFDAGFRPNEQDLAQLYNPHDIDHVRRLKEFLLDNFVSRTLYALPDKKLFLLVGRRLNLQISAYRDESSDERATWDIAFARGAFPLRTGAEKTDLDDTRLRIETVRDFRPGRHMSWARCLPVVEERGPSLSELEQFRNFLRCTNQLDLVMRCTEIFPYRMLPSKPEDSDGFYQTIRLEPVAQNEELQIFIRNEGGMLEFFQREWESNKRGSDRVLLSEDGTLRHRPASEAELWEIRGIKPGSGGYIELRRRRSEQLATPSVQGYIRSSGFHGQIRLIQRRREAIDRLEEHTYLLKALCQPSFVFIDTREVELPHQPPAMLDESKIAVMQDVLRTRPIYALQGPPGTGKTTLVAHLARQILEEDPVAQILVTAQAHGAVDVLREKVMKEAFQDVPRDEKPMMVRLGLGEPDDPDMQLEGTVEKTSSDLLAETAAAMRNQPSLTPIQQEWLNLIEDLHRAARTRQPYEDFTEFQELVRRGANIIFCTTSAGDLEDLAKGEQFFDWAVVEEAGKVHAYDLALPLQAGHRWLLLGDHKQLPPYRLDDFKKAIDHLDVAMRILDSLSGPDRGLVDADWLGAWRELQDKARAEATDKPLSASETQSPFQKYALDWLEAFKEFFGRVSKVHGTTMWKSVGAMAGKLSAQYRMHPAIGRLISGTFYDNLVVDKTDEERLLHCFEEPYAIQGKALVWIDLPWADRADSPFHEHSSPRYTNSQETEEIKRFIERLRFKRAPTKPQYLAVLSPYNRQRRKLDDALAGVRLPEGLYFRESLAARPGSRGDLRRAHTVDSFQGNQADIVIISLVRNNEFLPKHSSAQGEPRRMPDPMGFLDDKQRLNVLLSRAERLLVLVGSWEFFERQVQGISLRMDPNTYLWHWKNLLTMFQEFEGLKKAVRIPYRERGAVPGGRP